MSLELACQARFTVCAEPLETEDHPGREHPSSLTVVIPTQALLARRIRIKVATFV
jgi:hypothetical protein